MKKAEQIEINKKVLEAMHEALVELENDEREGSVSWTHLNYCQASYAFTSGRYIVLKSYNTVVAAIDTRDGVCYDFSRWVYGYTATTTQHIYKFAKKFGTSVVSYKPV